METALILALAFVTSAIGALGGLGGAILLVPVLVLTGMSPSQASPLGLLSVASGSLSAGAHQLAERTVHHRLGVTTETAASAGAVAGALLSGAVGEVFLRRVLALVALAAALASVVGRDVTHRVVNGIADGDLGERRGTLAGAYAVQGGAAPYEAKRLPAGLAVMSLAGFVAGIAGASGGFIKTPTATEIMRVPVKVAASTTTFTVGITSAAALIIFAIHGRIDLNHASPVIAGSLLGGQFGARLQDRLGPSMIRRALSAVLIVVAVILFTQA